MPRLDQIPENPEAESKFRKGYTHGVEAMMLAVQAKLSPEDTRKLRQWTNKLLEWRTGGRGFEAPDAPNLD